MSTLPLVAPASWRLVLRSNFTRLEPLIEFLQLSDEQKKQIYFDSSFVLNLPMRIAKKIEKGTLHDPLLKQFLPLINEQNSAINFINDPVHDFTFCKSSKLLHKYDGRVLLVCTSACAMHCRYCFRQNFAYDTQNKSFENEINIIKSDSSIKEVILSGGDPLSLSEEVLEDLLFSLDKIKHVKRIRFHSRFPIGIPERIDSRFLSMIDKLDKQIWFIVHVNHARELDEDIYDALHSMHQLGVHLLNQSVLLKGVNDDTQTLKELCEALMDFNVKPYYLHQLDRVKGTSHFEVPVEKGKQLMQELCKVLPGYGVPRYVSEVPGEPSKSLIF